MPLNPSPSIDLPATRSSTGRALPARLHAGRLGGGSVELEEQEVAA